MHDRISAAAQSCFRPETALRLLRELEQDAAESSVDLSVCSVGFLSHLADLLIISLPMHDALRVHPDWLTWLSRLMDGFEAEPSVRQTPEAAWACWVEDQGPAALTLDGLRAFKRREYIRIAWLDLAGWISFQTTVEQLSALAVFVIERVLQFCWQDLRESAPADMRACESAQGFAVFAFGKLGGNELNYSSDVDLVFCRRDSEGESERRFYTRLGERLISSLSHAGPDGFLYRVDMRLRPHGETGPLVPTLSSLVNYYESWGEAWERQALIKARPIAGSEEIRRRFSDFSARFTFARQMDDSSLEDIKRVKHRAEREYGQGENRFHLKQGPGGIRDIEFYIQYLQLIAGWAHPEARAASSLNAISGLSVAKSLLDGEESILSLAYVFYRIVEHRLQLRALTPQAVIPRGEDEVALLARGLGFGQDLRTAQEQFAAVLTSYRSRVRAILERIYLTPGYLRLTEQEEELARMLSDRTPKERVRELLSPYGFRDIDKAWQNIRLIALGPAGELLPPRERRLFLEFAFPLLEVLRESIDPDLALHHLESFAAASGNRISFLRTLASRRSHLSRLINLLALSNLAHQILLRHPEYFDSLARGVHMHEGRGWQDMYGEVRNRLGASPRGESPAAVIRKFKQREIVRIAYRDLAGLADPIEVSRELSNLGEACVRAAVELTRPPVEDFGRGPEETLHVIAMGKLGSRFMHYASDLDLMFLYDAPRDASDAGLREAIQLRSDERVERIVELLSAVTSDGIVYDLDLRLRPEGSSGLLARSWESFTEYAQRHMEPWERLALVRSRMLNGTPDSEIRWEALIETIVYGHPWNEQMFEELRHLKRRIETEKNRENRIQLDFKYGRGGVVDLEFLVQWLQLQHGGATPPVRNPSLSAALPALRDAGVITEAECSQLRAAHHFQRKLENRYQLVEEWNSREIVRESPILGRLARSMGYHSDSPSAAGRDLLMDWTHHASHVRAMVDKFIFSL
jgi:[glutamine synthetase] adenylyltransferase / [glutamine synthetase]-adenylyl-L-tyrosine phosphorylase